MILSTSIAGGGAERNAALLSRHLDADVTVGVYTMKPSSYQHGGRLVDLEITPTRGLVKKILRFVQSWRQIRLLKRRINVDATISFLDPPGLMNLLTAGNGKTIVSVRNYKSIEDRRGGGGLTAGANRLLRMLYRRADTVVAVSHAMARDLANNYGIQQHKLRVINNPCDVASIRRLACEPLPTHLAAVFESPVIITVGRMEEQKGHRHLVRVFARVRRTNPETKLVIVGEGRLTDEVIRVGRGLGLNVYSSGDAAPGLPAAEHDLFILGFQSNPFAFLKRSSIFALPSLFEGFPNVLLEAMACDIPIVAADCLSGPREILAPDLDYEGAIALPHKAKYGILLPVFDSTIHSAAQELTEPESVWADQISTLLRDARQRNALRDKARQRVTDFGIKNIIREWEQIIEAD